MHAVIFEKFNALLTEREWSGPVLEVGAVPTEKTLLNLPVLRNVTARTGINLEGPFTFKDFEILKGDANNMNQFPDNHFGLVLCNAMLEHDKFFWKSVEEVRRVTRPGGLLVIGTPGFADNSFQKFKKGFEKQLWYKAIKSSKTFGFLLSSTLTLEVHGGAYGDFYRFSPAFFREIIFRDFHSVEIIHIMRPPRIIGLGCKPGPDPRSR